MIVTRWFSDAEGWYEVDRDIPMTRMEQRKFYADTSYIPSGISKKDINFLIRGSCIGPNEIEEFIKCL